MADDQKETPTTEAEAVVEKKDEYAEALKVVEANKAKRETECAAKIQAVLQEYNCKLTTTFSVASN